MAARRKAGSKTVSHAGPSSPILPFVTASPRADVARATGWGLFIAALVLAGIYFGSRRLRDFDVGARPLRGRQRLFRVRPRLPLLDVADEAADAPLLAARLAAVLRAVARWRRTSPVSPRSSP